MRCAACCISLAAASSLAAPAVGQTQTFTLGPQIEVGGAFGGGPAAEWNYFLGAEWDGGVSVGGVTTGPNVQILPEISFLGVTLPEVRADTRTGLQLDLHSSGRAGKARSWPPAAGRLTSLMPRRSASRRISPGCAPTER